MHKHYWKLTLGALGIALICLSAATELMAEPGKNPGQAPQSRETKTVRGPTVIVEWLPRDLPGPAGGTQRPGGSMA